MTDKITKFPNNVTANHSTYVNLGSSTKRLSTTPGGRDDDVRKCEVVSQAYFVFPKNLL